MDAWGRVGPASEASGIATLREYKFENTKQVTLDWAAAPAELLTSDAGRGTSATVRIYRANYGVSGQGIFQFVAEVPVATTQYLDTVYSGDLLEGVTTTDWNGPPDDDTALFPNGPVKKFVVMGTFVAGHNDKIICFSEPETTHAFPPRYYKVVEENLVTIHMMGTDLVVLTDGYPYILTGIHPEAIAVTKLSERVPCTCPSAVTEVNDAVYYASSTGLYEIRRGAAPTNVIRPYYTEYEWGLLDPTNMEFSNYDGRVFIHCRSLGYTMVYDPQNPSDALRRIQINPQALAQMDGTNDLAFVNNGSADIEVFDSASTTMNIAWESKHYEVNDPTQITFGKVEANNYPVTVTFHYRDLSGVVHNYEKAVNDSRFFPLGFRNLGREFWVSASAAADNDVEIRTIQMASSPSEFS